ALAPIAPGKTTPDSKTLAPSRVTSRSSANVFRRCVTTLAIFNLQEFDPISIAANVGIGVFYALPEEESPSAKIHDPAAAGESARQSRQRTRHSHTPVG